MLHVCVIHGAVVCVQRAIDAHAATSHSDLLVFNDETLHGLVMSTIDRFVQGSEVGCVVLRIAAFEAPTPFQSLPLWPVSPLKQDPVE